MKSLKVISFIFKQYKDIKSYGIKELIRKLILTLKILINFPLFGVGIFMCIIIRLLSPFFIIRIARAPCSNFGNFTADMAIYCAKKQLNVDQLQKKHLDFFYILPSSKIYNRQLEKMWKREVFFLSGYFLWPVDCINKIIPGWRKHSIKGLSYNIERDKNNLIEQYQPPKFTNEEEVRGKELLKKFGLTENDKFVCLSIRDNI